MPQTRPSLPPLARPVAIPVARPIDAPSREPPASLYAVVMTGCAIAATEALGCFLILTADATPRALAAAIAAAACLGFIMLVTLGFGLFYRHLHARAGAPSHTTGRARAAVLVPVVNLLVGVALVGFMAHRSAQTTEADARAARWARNNPTASPLPYVPAPPTYDRVTLTFLNSTGHPLDAVTVIAPDGLRVPLGPLAPNAGVSQEVALGGHASLDAIYVIGQQTWKENVVSQIAGGQTSFPTRGIDIRLPSRVAAAIASGTPLALAADAGPARAAVAPSAVAKRPAAPPSGTVANRPAVRPLKSPLVLRRHYEPQYLTTVVTLATSGELTWEQTEFESSRPNVQSRFTKRVTRRRGELSPDEVAAIAQELQGWPQWAQIPTNGRELNAAVLEVHYGVLTASDLQIRAPRPMRDLYDRLERRGRELPLIE